MWVWNFRSSYFKCNIGNHLTSYQNLLEENALKDSPNRRIVGTRAHIVEKKKRKEKNRSIVLIRTIRMIFSSKQIMRAGRLVACIPFKICGWHVDFYEISHHKWKNFFNNKSDVMAFYILELAFSNLCRLPGSIRRKDTPVGTARIDVLASKLRVLFSDWND